jgi:pimeloyl-ACP methyl ester carboxylesterase
MRLATKIYREPGCRRDIVLLHGTGARAEMWRRQLDVLIELGYRCIVPDLRGHGDSIEPGEKTDIEAHLKDIVDTLRDIDDLRAPATFAGHSLGAIISMHLAERQPQYVSKILAVSMPGRVPRMTREAFHWFLKAGPYQAIRKTGVHKYFDWRTRELIATNPHALEQIIVNFMDLDYATNVPRVECPVHFAVGRLDPVAPWQYCEMMHKALPNSTLKIIEWAGHNPMDSQARVFNEWMLEKVRD